MATNETTEGRRTRLKALAKKRVAALVTDRVVLPHWASEQDIDAARNGLVTTRQLLETGSATFQIDKHIFEISESADLGEPPDRVFLINVDGVFLDAWLRCRSGATGHDLALIADRELSVTLQENTGYLAGAHEETDVYSLMYFALLGNDSRQWFSQYVAECQRKHAQHVREQLIHLQQRDALIHSEVERFRDVLVRKYRQLAFTDEYETLDDSRFIDELKRFASRRVPDLDPNLVVERAKTLVVSWASETSGPNDTLNFSPDMDPREYERYCSALCESAGWHAQLTRTSGDQGVDIICEGKGVRLVVQCKLYSSPVGNSAVQEVIAAREFEYADVAAVVSNATFTRSAREIANVANVLLLHHEQLRSLSPESLRGAAESTGKV